MQLPNLNVVTTGHPLFNLTDLKEKIVIIYFYPKDNTPGCTQEAQDFRDHFTEFQQIDALIYGVSRDSISSHERFKTKQKLPFELISDPEEKLCELFNIMKPKTMFGKLCMGIERTTFLFDQSGTLHKEWRKVSVKNHVKDVLAVAQSLTRKN